MTSSSPISAHVYGGRHRLHTLTDGLVQLVVDAELKKGTLVSIDDGNIPANIQGEQPGKGYMLYGFGHDVVFPYAKLSPPAAASADSKEHYDMGLLVSANMAMRQAVPQDREDGKTVFNSAKSRNALNYSVHAASESIDNVERHAAMVYTNIIAQHPFDNANGRAALFAVYATFYEAGWMLNMEPAELYGRTTGAADSMQLDFNDGTDLADFRAYFMNYISDSAEEVEDRTPAGKRVYYADMIPKIAAASAVANAKHAGHEDFEIDRDTGKGEFQKLRKARVDAAAGDGAAAAAATGEATAAATATGVGTATAPVNAGGAATPAASTLNVKTGAGK